MVRIGKSHTGAPCPAACKPPCATGLVAIPGERNASIGKWAAQRRKSPSRAGLDAIICRTSCGK